MMTHDPASGGGVVPALEAAVKASKEEQTVRFAAAGEVRFIEDLMAKYADDFVRHSTVFLDHYPRTSRHYHHPTRRRACLVLMHAWYSHALLRHYAYRMLPDAESSDADWGLESDWRVSG